MKSFLTLSTLLVLTFLCGDSVQEKSMQSPTRPTRLQRRAAANWPDEGSCRGKNSNSIYMPALVCTQHKIQKTPFVPIQKKDCMDALKLFNYPSTKTNDPKNILSTHVCRSCQVTIECSTGVYEPKMRTQFIPDKHIGFEAMVDNCCPFGFDLGVRWPDANSPNTFAIHVTHPSPGKHRDECA